MATRDWLAIKTEYVTSEISLRDLARKLGIPASTLIDQSTKGAWETERGQFRVRTAQKTLELAEAAQIDVRREILESFVEARKAWAQSRRKADDYGALARLAASVVGLDTEHGSHVVELNDWRAGKSKEYVDAVEEAAQIVNGRSLSS